MKKLISSTLAIIALALTAKAAPILDEQFTYSDGSLITNSAFLWNPNTGATGQLQVVSGKINMRAGNATAPTGTEDVFRTLPGGPYSTNFNMYFSFEVNFSELPANGSGYFAHLKDGGSGFRALKRSLRAQHGRGG